MLLCPSNCSHWRGREYGIEPHDAHSIEVHRVESRCGQQTQNLLNCGFLFLRRVVPITSHLLLIAHAGCHAKNKLDCSLYTAIMKYPQHDHRSLTMKSLCRHCEGTAPCLKNIFHLMRVALMAPSTDSTDLIEPLDILSIHLRELFSKSSISDHHRLPYSEVLATSVTNSMHSLSCSSSCHSFRSLQWELGSRDPYHRQSALVVPLEASGTQTYTTMPAFLDGTVPAPQVF